MDPDIVIRLQEVASEFELGAVDGMVALGGGSHPAYRLATSTGAFLVKPPEAVWDPREIELYADVERTLNASGVRQARLFARPSGELFSTHGCYVQEFVEGESTTTPDEVDSLGFARSLASYNLALRALPAPEFVGSLDTSWKRANSLDYLLDSLRPILDDVGLTDDEVAALRRGLDLLEPLRDDLRRLPAQLIHGDAGPGNVLYSHADESVIIDFTPYFDSHLYSLCIAQYWNHAYFTGGVIAVDRVAAELREYQKLLPLAPEERDLFAPLFVRAAVRMLAQPAVFRIDGAPLTGSQQDIDRRVRILHAAIDQQAELRDAVG